MWNPPSLEPKDIIGNEIFNLLAKYYAYSRKREMSLMPHFSRHDLVAELIALNSIEHELVIVLCRLDDEEKRQWSFRQLIKLLREQIRDAAKLKQIDEAIKAYRKLINPLKVKYRNQRIAHLSTELSELPQPDELIHESIVSAVSLYDLIAGEKQNYILRVGSQELAINLRESAQA